MNKYTSSISVVTICFNEVNTIRRTMDSVASQSVQPEEWIIIDGGSNDGSLEIIGEYKEYYTLLLNDVADGIYSAMNTGITFAKGDFILFLNGGDYFYNNSAIEVALLSLNNNLDLLLCNIKVRDKNMTHDWLTSSKIDRHILYKGSLPHCGTIISKKLFDQIGQYDTRFSLSGDYEWFVRLVDKVKVLNVLSSEHFLSVYHKDGASSLNRTLGIKEDKIIRRTYYNIFYRLKRNEEFWSFIRTSMVRPRFFFGTVKGLFSSSDRN